MNRRLTYCRRRRRIAPIVTRGLHTPRTKIRDKVFGFKGHFIAGDARISFSAHDDGSGVVYHSDPDGQRTVGAGVGHERNGVFF